MYFLSHEVFDNDDILCKIFGRDKWEKFRTPFNNLRKNVEITQIASMNGRAGEYSDNIRICIPLKTCTKAVELVKNLNYSGDINLFADTVSELEKYTSRKIWGIDFELFPDSRISDKIGAAFFAKQTTQDIIALMNFLVTKGFCIPEKADAIINWRRANLPEDICNQGIFHIKFQFEKNKIILVKAYLIHQDFPAI